MPRDCSIYISPLGQIGTFIDCEPKCVDACSKKRLALNFEVALSVTCGYPLLLLTPTWVSQWRALKPQNSYIYI